MRIRKISCLLIMLIVLVSHTACASYGPSPTLCLGRLAITKCVTINGKETLDPKAQGYTFRFHISGPYGFFQNISITVNSGHETITLKNLEPGRYRVWEYGSPGCFTPQQAYLIAWTDYNTLASVTFVNEYTGRGTPFDPLWLFGDYMTALGIIVPYNQAGDCFD